MSRSALPGLQLALMLAAMLVISGDPAAHARDEDVCPEPNDVFQAACFLGTGSDALGYISHPADVDAFRIEVLDFDVGVRLELADRPLAYRLELANWNGDVVAVSSDGSVNAILNLPGTYYVFVDSPSGQFTDSRPYRIAFHVTYSQPDVPRVLFSQEFRSGVQDGTMSSDRADFAWSGGRFTIAMKVGGTRSDPIAAVAPRSMWGPELIDFTMVIDARTDENFSADHQYYVGFRSSLESGYIVWMEPVTRRISLTKSVDRQPIIVVPGFVTDALDASGGVNRLVLRCIGDSIRINVNGQEVIDVMDSVPGSGVFTFGVLTRGVPPTVHFDNILVTTSR
jgi:hypothetical protein